MREVAARREDVDQIVHDGYCEVACRGYSAVIAGCLDPGFNGETMPVKEAPPS